MRNSIGTSRSLTVSQRITRTVFVGRRRKEQPERNQKGQARCPRRPGIWASSRTRFGPRTAIAAPRSGKNGINHARSEIRHHCSSTRSPCSNSIALTGPSYRRTISTSSAAARSTAGPDALARRPRASGADMIPGRASLRSARPPAATSVAGSAFTPASRMSCQSVTSSDDRRLYRITIKASAIDASHAATVRITIVKTCPVHVPW